MTPSRTIETIFESCGGAAVIGRVDWGRVPRLSSKSGVLNPAGACRLVRPSGVHSLIGNLPGGHSRKRPVAAETSRATVNWNLQERSLG